jgi:hypothetical protein
MYQASTYPRKLLVVAAFLRSASAHIHISKAVNIAARYRRQIYATVTETAEYAAPQHFDAVIDSEYDKKAHGSCLRRDILLAPLGFTMVTMFVNLPLHDFIPNHPWSDSTYWNDDYGWI